MEEVIEDNRVAVELVSRVQIRAVLSGLLIAAGVDAVCLGLSWAIGLSTFQPTVGHARGLALSNIIWGAIALWISLFFGGYFAALIGRSSESRSGALHGLVVWGASATLLGVMVMMMLSGVLGSVIQMTEPGPVAAIGARRLEALRPAANLIIWLYWAGIVGGLFSATIGGFLGARSELRGAPRRVIVREPIVPGVPQHA